MKTDDGYVIDIGTKLIYEGEDDSDYIVSVPVAGNELKTRKVKISKKYATKGSMEFTQANVIKQALKFVGKAYGWGHSNSTRDCSGFIRDVYRSFGIVIPRDASSQEHDVIEKSIYFTNAGSQNDREKLMMLLNAGSTLYLKG